MQIGNALRAAGIPAADAEILLAFLLTKDRSWLLGHAEEELSASDAREFKKLCGRRKGSEPIAYIVGEKEFYGRPFLVEPGVLIPRPSTEALIDLTLFLLQGKTTNETREADKGIVVVSKIFGEESDVRTIVDVGTGSGCIAVTLACENPDLRCIAVDSSEKSVSVAQKNVKKHNVENRIDVRVGNLLEPVMDLRETFIVVSNPPYVKDEALLSEETRRFEPSEALFGHENDGGGLLRELCLQAKNHPFCRGIVVECLKSQSLIPLSLQALRPT